MGAGSLAGLSLLVLLLSGHVGTLDAFFTGSAGPYKVQVTVRPAGVVPGLAQVMVRVNAHGVTRVTTQASQWNVGSHGAPAPDQALRVPGDSALWSSQLWLMTRSSYAVHVTIEGSAGLGSVTVPVSNMATQKLSMPRALGWVLAALGLFLSLGFVSLIGAAVRESVLPPGEEPAPSRRARARVAMGGGVLLLVVALSAGRAWWNTVDAAYARGLYKPMPSTASMRLVDGSRRVRIEITDSSLLQKVATPLIPDHGKLMHVFLVGDGATLPFAHLHPIAVDSATYEANVGAIPAGRYRYFADVVHESGFAETMTGALQLEAGNPVDSVFSDGDDAWRGAPPTGQVRDEMATGGSVEWERPSRLTKGEDVSLRFTVRERDGTLATLAPYMGMPAHAAIASEDGRVFAHLHSNGSFSMAAQQVLAAVERGDTLEARRPGVPRPRIDPIPQHAMELSADGHLEFLFAFPKAGKYTIWVQFREGGAIRTAAFDAIVQ